MPKIQSVRKQQWKWIQLAGVLLANTVFIFLTSLALVYPATFEQIMVLVIADVLVIFGSLFFVRGDFDFWK